MIALRAKRDATHLSAPYKRDEAGNKVEVRGHANEDGQRMVILNEIAIKAKPDKYSLIHKWGHCLGDY